MPERITCIQLWNRYVNADKLKDELRYKWKNRVDKLHDTEYRIEMVNATIKQEYSKLPDKSLGIVIPMDTQKKLLFLHKELKALKCTRKELHYVIVNYKKACEETTTRANRYLMAYKRVVSIVWKRVSGKVKSGEIATDVKINEIRKYPCTLFTNRSTGNITVVLKGEGGDSDIEIKY